MTAVVTVFGGVGDGIAKSRRAMEQFDRIRTAAQQLRIGSARGDGDAGRSSVRPEERRRVSRIYRRRPRERSPGESIRAFPQAINAVTDGERFDRGPARRHPDVHHPQRHPTVPGPVSLHDTTPQPHAAIRRGRGGLVPPRHDVAPPRLVGGPWRGSDSGIRQTPQGTFYASNDISVRLVNGQLVPNSLGDLTKRENRFAHPGIHVSVRRPRLGVSGASHVGRMLVADLDEQLGQWHHAAPTEFTAELLPRSTLGQREYRQRLWTARRERLARSVYGTGSTAGRAPAWPTTWS